MEQEMEQEVEQNGVSSKSSDVSDGVAVTHEQVIEAIMFEAEQHELAFVSDDFIEGEDGESVYSPFVDRETAMLWLRTKLEELSEAKPSETNRKDHA